MDYGDEDKEDKKYKKGYGRKQFKKDIAEAVKPQVDKLKALKGKKKKTQNPCRLCQGTIPWLQERWAEYVRKNVSRRTT